MFKPSIALLLFIALLAPAQQQPAAGSSPFAGKISIPVQLLKTVRADRAHPGDQVEFRTLEAVLVGKDLVMPADSALYGRVVSANPKQNDKNSWLVVVVERAKWKEHTLPLHAFVSAQIALTEPKSPRAGEPATGNDTSLNRRTARQAARTSAMTDPTLSNLIRTPQDASEAAREESRTKYPSLENVGILRDKDGTTYLVSSKSTVKLPAGVLLMLSNEPVANSKTTQGGTTASPSGIPPPL